MTTRTTIRSALALGVLALWACDPGADAPSADGGTACTSSAECPGALECAGGRCVRPGCEPGSEGCTCGAGDRCARGSDGMPLVCMEGVCSSMTCPAGEHTCVCIDGVECRRENDVCADGRCIAGDCVAGTEDCPCLVGSCDSGLYCLEGSLCVDDDGYAGGACLPNSRCHSGARCDAALDQCVRCERGTEGCACNGGACGGGLSCLADLCVSQSRVPPRDPVCFTPCSASAEVDGAPRTCDVDGLMRGCIDGRACVGGSCVRPGEDPPSCASDLECPDFQTCLAGRCYSNCEASVDCPPGLGCHRHVCRVPCESSAGGSTCGSGQHCDAPDGANGYCVALPRAAGPAEPPPAAAFELSRRSLELSNVSTSEHFQILIAEDDGALRRFVVRKVRHTLTRADGTTESVTAPRDPVSGEYLPCDAARGECPLAWLELSSSGAATREPTLSVQGEAGCEADDCPRVTVSRAAAAGIVRWEGELEITSARGSDRIQLSYTELPEGAWVGSMYYYGNFDTGGLELWRAQADRTDTSRVNNALLLRWAAFRRGRLPGGWDEMQAVLRSTEEESWRFPSVAERCRELNSGSTVARCYPYTNASGIQTYVNEDSPIPRGVTEFPFSMNLRRGADPRELVGRVESRETLHYPGDPEVTLRLAADPQSPSSCSTRVRTDCIVQMDRLDVTSVVGGRYVGDATSCAPGFATARVPWLVSGFGLGTTMDEDGTRYLRACLGNTLPFVAGSRDAAARSTSLAWSNPIPDGRARPRTLALLDGALINQSQLFVLFEERVESFLPGADPEVAGYGYLLLTRQATDLDLRDENGNGAPDVLEGNPRPTLPAPPPVASGAACPPELIEQVLPGATGSLAGLDDASRATLVEVLINGTAPSSGGVIARDTVHYLCEDTGLFDGGARDDGSASRAPIPCPVGSRVTYFVAPGHTQASIAAEPCQRDVSCVTGPSGTTCTGGTCRETLNLWARSGRVELFPSSFCGGELGDLPCFEPLAVCDGTAVYCDDDRFDLRAGKTFYRPAAPNVRALRSLQAEIEAAFRYRTRFTSSTGSRVGFAPVECIPGSDRVRYCYDAPVIEEIRQRLDCLIAVYSRRSDVARLPAPTASRLVRVLKGSFSQFADPSGPRDGFERLYAELLVMMGDEALTSAFASRFDLAAVRGASFQGELFEPGGINLAGVAGFEMQSLYRATQYYQLALDRLYRLGPDMAVALSTGPTDSPQNFLSASTVPLYLERLIRASTQKARAQSEIAKRYQSFNRPELARRVIERAYVAAQLESSILSRLMTQLADLSTPENRAQIELTITQAQRRYRMALLEMRDLYASIDDDVNVFGLPPDYIPFPVLDASVRGRNAVEVLLDVADSRVSFARVRELEALASNRSFQTDTAQFQAELVRIRNTYEAQLGELCGTFASPRDGLVYAGTRRNASLHPAAELLGDPCGLVGNGSIHASIAGYEDALAYERLLQARFRNTIAEVGIERARVSEQCGLVRETARYEFEQAGLIRDLRTAQSRIETGMLARSRMIEAQAELTTAAACIPGMFVGTEISIDVTTCPNQQISAIIRSFAASQDVEQTVAGRHRIEDLERDVASIQAATGRWVTERQCDTALIDSNARTAVLLLGLHELEIEAIRAERQSRLRLSEVHHLYDRARRIQAEQQEGEELLVDVEAARNDPNIRVYRNDAIINADVAFQDALRAVYRATRVLEYYTSQSYGPREQLFLIRMVTAGDYNLENYMLALRNAYLDFEETFGARDARVQVISLRDDILRIPRLDDEGRPLDQSARIAMMRERLSSSDLLDENGYLTIGFSTASEQLSPLTRAHRIDFVEAEIIGSSVGDTVGRVYVRQAGTSVVHGVDGRTRYHVFPRRTSVVNTFFNGTRVFPPNVYQSFRLQERPFLNTSWELVINQRDEHANRDIQLASLTDVRIYAYYSDFTVF